MIAEWLLMEACKLVVVPVLTKVREPIVDHFSDTIVGQLREVLPPAFSKALFGPVSGVPAGSNPTQTSNTAPTEIDLAKAIGDVAPEARDALAGEMERILDVKLGADDVEQAARGTDAWYVSAYAAIFWRIAMLAVWEDRPIAIQGALQGRGWVTVCAPKVRGPIAPSSMWQVWQQPDPRVLRRVWQDRGPVDFFVRQIKDEAARKAEIASLNREFIIEPGDPFRPAKAESIEDGWHRIDGASRAWVLLQPDATAERAIRRKRPPGLPDLLSPKKENLWDGSFDLYPPKYKEYPADWLELLDINSPPEGIAALSAGADEFSAESETSTQAVEAALAKAGGGPE